MVNRTPSVDDTSNNLQVGFAKLEDEKAVVTKSSFDRRSSLRTRSQKTDYKALHNGTDPLKQLKKRKSAVEANREPLSEKKRTKLSPPPASGPPVSNPTQDATAMLPRDTVLGTINTRSSGSSRQEIKAPSVTPVDNATAPSAQPTGSGSIEYLPESTPKNQISSARNMATAPTFARPALHDGISDYDLDVESLKTRQEQWRSTQNDVNYGTSQEWQANIEQSRMLAEQDVRRMNELKVALQRRVIGPYQLPSLLGDRTDHDSALRFRSSGALTLAPEDTPSIEALTTSGPAVASTSASYVPSPPPLELSSELQPPLLMTDLEEEF